MFRDSQRSFEFSRLNSLLSWAFSRQEKNKKHWNYQSICDTWVLRKWSWHFKHQLCWTLFSLYWFFCIYEIKKQWAFIKNTTQKSINVSATTSMSWYYLHLVHLILNAKKPNNLMRKTSGGVFLEYWSGWVFHIFPRLHSIMR